MPMKNHKTQKCQIWFACDNKNRAEKAKIVPKENVNLPKPLSINLPTNGADIAATMRDKVQAPVKEVLEKPEKKNIAHSKTGLSNNTVMMCRKSFHYLFKKDYLNI